ncbi:histidine triad nucleotide-binding protein [Niveomyces insectorum RCEF 264]|uniref:Histidine triad nucleotide-binding protein n=1 Tax=Niveomyces insectorum RCEF 264 TaxID=1081102 RepID=A0A167X7W0_9HYPO|nr:histidine triad nucleotide-binding protein [Niveomyces insectorum RCEF 264]
MAGEHGEDYEDAMTEEELAGSAAEQTTTKDNKRANNAFAELMAPKRAKPPPPPPPPSHAYGARYLPGREALGMYIANPAKYTPKTTTTTTTTTATSGDVAGQVIYFSDDFVAVHDKFPKSAVHCLLLPRDPAVSRQHPVALLNRTDPDGVLLRQRICAEAAKLQAIVAAELRRRFGRFSAADAAREAVLRGEGDDNKDGNDDTAAILPPGRDWSQEVLVGVHARPSMNHLHVHVLSRDMHSARLRNRKHYNSFTTPFLVRLEEFPLAADDPRQPGPHHTSSTRRDEGGGGGGGGSGSVRGDGGHTGFLGRSMTCWRCRKGFGNKFQELKRHLDVEFEAWKRE